MSGSLPAGDVGENSFPHSSEMACDSFSSTTNNFGVQTKSSQQLSWNLMQSFKSLN